MEALLSVTTKCWSDLSDRRVPPEIHTHDVLHGGLITLEAMGQRYQVHVTDITPDGITLEVEGLSPVGEYREGKKRGARVLGRYTLARNGSISLSVPKMDRAPTWTIELTKVAATS
jgi:hypothetical protein